jgi:glycosyltransferase involved in cell wall biosynthesis
MFFNWKFDKKFYLATNPDVSKAKLDPYKHYLEYGKLEGRLPTREAMLPIIDTDQICHKHNFTSLTSIPLIIPTFNNPTYLKRFIHQLQRFPKLQIMIYDNNSTYAPMLQLLNKLENSYVIIRNSENRGPEFVYQDQNLLKTLPPQFLLSDPDLDLNPELPIDFFETFFALTEFYKIGKAGSALSIPDNFKTRQKLVRHDVTTTAIEYENQYWQNLTGFVQRDDAKIFGAALGATLCLVNLKYLNNDNHWSRGIRVAGIYENKHLPWELYFELPKVEKDYYNLVQKFSFYTPKS